MTMQTEQLIEAGKKVTLKAMEADLRNGYSWALAYASEEQALKLCDRLENDDLYTHWMDYQEELRCEMACF